jgi:hypothetical protein
MLGALRLPGLVAAMTVDGCTAGDVFRALRRAVGGPPRRPGPMLLMEHLTAQQGAGGAATCAAAGVR